MLTCQYDVDMFTRGRIVLSSSKPAHVDWNWHISREKYLKIDWELQAPSDGLLQLPHIPVTAFSQTDLFLVCIGLNITLGRAEQK